MQITKSGLDILKDDKYFNYKEIIFKVTKTTKKNKKTKEVLKIDNNDLQILTSLKELRLNIAREKSIPAFVIFPDSSLIEMAKIKPQNLQEMIKINGVGPSKLKKYGTSFLEVINK